MTDNKSFQEDISACLTYLEQGKLVLYPTDTIWGIGCDAMDNAAVQKIIELKNRPGSKSFVILVENIAQIGHYAIPPSEAMLDFRRNSSKPVTFILNGAKNLSPHVINIDGSVAIRVPEDDFCQQLLMKFGKPIVSTSANLSGQPTPANFKEIEPIIKEQVDYVVAYNQSDETIKVGSQIIKEGELGNIVVIRS